MKIKCKFCENMIDDTNAVCPHCGAPNENVVRTTKSQPQTIAELKQWYSDRQLPPYEVTRFFIGENYRQPRAFGIYKDETSGNFIVYKNKDSGERAVRYEGTDEAYAVNELFMRLKQEIIQQKKGASGSSHSGSHTSSGNGGLFGMIGTLVKGAFTMLSWLIMLLIGMSFIWSLGLNEPKPGYYDFNGAPYYYFDQASQWYAIDSSTGDWQTRGTSLESAPEELQKKSRSKRYFKSKYWNEKLGMPNFTQSLAFDDYYNSSTNTGYYKYDGTTYYNLTGGLDDGWYSYDDYDSTWSKVDYEYVPEDLTHNSTVGDFYDTPEWDSSLQVSEFEDTPAYEEYQDSYSYSSSSDDGWFSSSDDSDYDWGSSDSWDSDWGSDSWDSDW